MALNFSLFPPSHRAGLRRYLIGWLPGLMAMALLWLVLGYQDSFLLVNGWRLGWLDVLMPHFTHLGDGLLLFALAGLLVLGRREVPLWGVLLAVLLSVMVLVFLLKNLVFSGWQRPPVVFAYPEQEFFLISTRSLSSFSFPSGHATASAAAWLLPALALGRSGWAWACSLLGFLLAYSRVYIGVHFVGDILAGSLLGLALASGGYLWLYPYLQRRWEGLSAQRQGRWQRGLWVLTGFLGVVALVGVYGRYYG